MLFHGPVPLLPDVSSVLHMAVPLLLLRMPHMIIPLTYTGVT